MANPPEDRSPVALAAAWASRTITVAVEMVLPGLIGLWIDEKLGTRFVFALLGFGLGLTLAIFHLLRMTRPQARPASKQEAGEKEKRDLPGRRADHED